MSKTKRKAKTLTDILEHSKDEAALSRALFELADRAVITVTSNGLSIKPKEDSRDLFSKRTFSQLARLLTGAFPKSEKATMVVTFDLSNKSAEDNEITIQVKKRGKTFRTWQGYQEDENSICKWAYGDAELELGIYDGLQADPKGPDDPS